MSIELKIMKVLMNMRHLLRFPTKQSANKCDSQSKYYFCHVRPLDLEDFKTFQKTQLTIPSPLWEVYFIDDTTFYFTLLKFLMKIWIFLRACVCQFLVQDLLRQF